MTNYVFLGGTVANNLWRNQVIDQLLARGIRDNQIFNPVVEHWTTEIQEKEDRAKVDSNCLLTFVLASPDSFLNDQKFTAAYSLYEATSCLYDAAERTIVYFDYQGFDKRTEKGLKKIESDMRLRHTNAYIAISYDDLVDQIVWRIFR